MKSSENKSEEGLTLGLPLFKYLEKPVSILPNKMKNIQLQSFTHVLGVKFP